MRKYNRFITVMMTCILIFVGCKSKDPASDITRNSVKEMQESQQISETHEEQSTVVDESKKGTTIEGTGTTVLTPLPVTIDITDLKNCKLAISLEKGDFYIDKPDTIKMDVTVFAYDLYDLADISHVKEGDSILRGKNEILISSIERRENGPILINGGLDNGGFELYNDENTVYYERGYSDIKQYYEIGKVSLLVSPDFVFNDASNLDNNLVVYDAEDFLNDATGIDYHFNPNNTSIVIENGYVMNMTRVYTP